MPRSHIAPSDLQPATLEAVTGLDHLARKQLHKISGLALVAAMRHCPHVVVPESYWRHAPDRLGYAWVVVDCPCGTHVVVEPLATPEPCECVRAYFYDGTQVWAWNSPRHPGTSPPSLGVD